MMLYKEKPDDVALYYEVHGAGKPLLLIAGLGADSSSWGGVTGKLAADFKVITLDNRGSGRSEIPETGYAMSRMAGDAVRVLDLLKIEKANVLGHSLGGYIAQELAIRYPGRVDRLILANTAAVSSERNNALFRKFYDEFQAGADLGAWIREWICWLFSPKRLARKAFVDACVKSGMSYPYRQQADGFKGQIDAIAAFDSRGRLDKIEAPTLVLEGEEDILIPPGEAEMLAKGIPNSVFHCVKDVAHCMHIENRDLFVKLVRDFLISE